MSNSMLPDFPSEKLQEYSPWTQKQWQNCQRSYFQEYPNLHIYLLTRRVIDMVVAGIGLILISPLLIAIALAVRLSSPGPILFRQRRLGRLGTTFTIYKFRTMIDGAIKLGPGLNTFKGDARITAVGQFLRDYHLDELPQLVNVLRGDMSLVGPRPLLPLHLTTYNDRQKQRLLLPPGITSWEAVEGGLDNPLEKRLELDLWYVEHCNFWVDLMILLRTILVVLRKEGVYEKVSASKPTD